jgi:hypothetical protein
MTKHVTEIVIFKVSNSEAGMRAARGIVEDARAFNNAIISAELYQSASDPNLLTQRIVWESLEEAKAAFAASEQFPNMAKMMELVTDQVFMDHFYLQKE